MELYNSLKKIDAHMHYNCSRSALLDQAYSEGFDLVSINTEVPFFPPLEEQENIVFSFKDRDEQRLHHLTTFSVDRWGEENWEQDALDQIQEGLANGAVGVKVWKNIGMTLQDEKDNFVMIDNPSFDSLFDYCERERVPVLGHLGEPKNCWLPLEEMTVKSDKDYFSKHPEYHMYLHPGYPSYDKQIEARNNRLEKHPELRFVGAHLASLEWSVDRVAAWLDRFPNTAVDLAERICHLQHQAITDWQKVRDFVYAYRDRIIYGSDIIDDGSKQPKEIKERILEKWRSHWQFFSTQDKMKVPKVEDSFRGLDLEESVLENIYLDNALRWYPKLKNMS